jgi:hypothetical protein
MVHKFTLFTQKPICGTSIQFTSSKCTVCSRNSKVSLKWNNVLQKAKYFIFKTYFVSITFDTFLQYFTFCKVCPLDYHHPVECKLVHTYSVSFPEVFLLICGQYPVRFRLLANLCLLADYHTFPFKYPQLKKSAERGDHGTSQK